LTEARGIQTNITIFEEKNSVGGRLLLQRNRDARAVQGFPNFSLEDIATGNLLYNRILRTRDAKWLEDGFGKNWKTEVKTSSVGFFDGGKILSVATRPVDKSGWTEWLGRIFRYGASVWRARKLPTGTMKGFEKFLDLEGTYEDVGQMLAATENGGPVATSAVERLKLNGLSQEYTREVLGPQVKRHTCQDVEELSDLALSMALDREDQGSQNSEVDGSLATVLSKFGDLSKAELKFSTKVSGLRREMVIEGRESWILEYSGAETKSGSSYEMFDKVIIAAPWNTSSLLSPDTWVDYEQIQYRSQWLTLFVSNSTLVTKDFGDPTNLPTQILPIPSSKLLQPFQGIQEITHLKEFTRFDHLTRITHLDHLYRIISDNKIDVSTIGQLSQAPDDQSKPRFHQEQIGNAYPLLYARSGGFPSFKVAEGLWHTSAVESIWSSVDLSWVAGENVARLVAQQIAKEAN
jgi:prenylcysteine oxidase / farnesylcysteine lyase